MRGKFGYWNNKNIRSGGEANEESLRMKRNGCRKLRGTEGKGKFDIETGWAQKVVERLGAKPRYWNDINEDTWWYMQKIAERRGGDFLDQKMNAGSCWEAQDGGKLDTETRCMQEGVERNGGTCSYWSQVTAENWWERGRWEGKARHRNKDERKKLLRREAEV